jgi:hypothetical protein
MMNFNQTKNMKELNQLDEEPTACIRLQSKRLNALSLIGNKEKLSAFATFIQHCTGDYGQCK